MVTYIRSDLDFILEQIKISEAHAAGQPLYGAGGLVPAYNLSLGLRTVDGTFNHLLPGQEKWGAANVQFPSHTRPGVQACGRHAFDPDGPGPAPAIPTHQTTIPRTIPGSLVFDSSLRTISNLLVDQTLGNPAAILEGSRARRFRRSDGRSARRHGDLPDVQAFLGCGVSGPRRDAERSDRGHRCR